ncbi:MAG TPA: VWA domain-containing protein, partial [Vicinamibacterales bacterium]
MRLHWAIAAILLAVVTVALPAQEQVRLRIASPSADAYVSGPVRLVAVIEPGMASRDVAELVFYGDGTQVCRLTAPPFECDWNSGERMSAHQVRAVATMKNGTRLVQSVRTKDVAFAEAVDVDVVQISAVVTDDNGRFVRGLKASDFKVEEDGKPQRLTHFAAENIPLELVAAIDVSGSMREAMPDVKAAAKEFLAGLEPKDQVTLLGFNDNIFTLARRSTDQAVRARAIDRIAPWGGTALYDVIIQAVDILGRQSGRRSIVLFSDGDDQSSRAPLEAAIARTEGSDATIYSIGQGRAVGSRTLQKLLQRLSDVSGGRSFFTDDRQKLQEIFKQILEDIRNQYLLAYPAPDSARNGEWHAIKVQAAGGKYHVRARQG